MTAPSTWSLTETQTPSLPAANWVLAAVNSSSR